MTSSITISTDLLAAVAKWASTDESLSHLGLIVFRKNEIIACDGHRLIRVQFRTQGLEFAVQRSHLLAAVAAQRELPGITLRDDENNKAIEVSLSENGRIRLSLGPVALVVPGGDLSTYPPIEQVMPEPREGQPPSPDGYVFNPRYLAALDEVNRAMGCDGGGARCVVWSGPEGSHRIRGAMLLSNARGARFVIMPMRDTHGGAE